MKGEKVMKTGKKTCLLALVMITIMLMATVPMVASAAADLSIGTITMTGPVDGVLSFTVPYTATDVENVTVLAVIGSGQTEPATIDSNNIAYINQQAASGATSFEFKVDVARFTPENNTIFIKIGGTAIDTAKAGDPIVYGAQPSGYTVSGYVQTYSAGATITISVDKSADTDANGQFILENVAPGEYNLVISAKAALPRTIPVTVTDSNVVVSTSDNKIGLMYGDVNSSGAIDNNDLMSVQDLFNKDLNAAEYSAEVDLNDSGTIDNNDLMVIQDYFNKAIADYIAWVK